MDGWDGWSRTRGSKIERRRTTGGGGGGRVAAIEPRSHDRRNAVTRLPRSSTTRIRPVPRLHSPYDPILSFYIYIYIPCSSVIHHSTRLGRVFVSSFLFFFFLSSFLSFFTFYEKRRGERAAVISSRIADFDEVARGL